MLGVPCDRFLTRPSSQTLEQGKQRRSIMCSDQPSRSRIVTGRIYGLLWNDAGHRQFVAALEQKNVDKVGCAPALQFPKPLSLTFVMRNAPACWIRRLVRGLQFNESACGGTGTD